jgi:uncharacterized membrane protein
MDYTEYLRELEEHLEVLPPEIRKAALEYYKKIFEEAGEAGEMGVLLRLGSAFSLAKKIVAEKSDYTDTDSYKALKLDFPDYAFPKTEEAPSVGADSIRPQNTPFENQRASIEKPQTDFARDLPAGAAPPVENSRASIDKPRYSSPDTYPPRADRMPNTPPNEYKTAPPPPPPPPVGFNGGLPRVEVRGNAYNSYQGTPRERSSKTASTVIGIVIALFVLFSGLIAVFTVFAAFIGNTTDYESIEYAETIMPAAIVEEIGEEDLQPGFPVHQYIYSGEIDTLSVYTYGANVTIVMDSEFKIESDRETAESGVFDVDFTDGYLSVSAFPEAGNVTIHVPNYINGSVEIYAEGGMIHMNNINAPDLYLTAENANVELYDNTFWQYSSLSLTNCSYYSSNNTFNGELYAIDYGEE